MSYIEEKSHIEYYKTLVDNLENEPVHEIDIYDKVSFLLDSFKSKLLTLRPCKQEKTHIINLEKFVAN